MLQTLAKPRRKKIHVGPDDHGRRMSLDDFDEAIAQEGYLYELNKGVIEVSGIPQLPHARQIEELREQLSSYRRKHPGVINFIGGGAEAKMLIGAVQSERHPDLSLYLDAPPDAKDLWLRWVPRIVVEVVSERSGKRDYEDKAGEYLLFGVDEYWIIDSFKQQMICLARFGGQWKPRIIKPSQKYTTRHLPGFSLDLKRVFAAAR